VEDPLCRELFTSELGRFRESIPDDSILLKIFAGEREDSSKTNRLRLATSPKQRCAKKTSLPNQNWQKKHLKTRILLVGQPKSMFKSFDRNCCTRHSSCKWKLVVNTSLILQQFIFSKFGARLTRIRFRIESESFASRPKESESHEHDFAGIVPALERNAKNHQRGHHTNYEKISEKYSYFLVCTELRQQKEKKNFLPAFFPS
jgi:hypothetical protein